MPAGLTQVLLAAVRRQGLADMEVSGDEASDDEMPDASCTIEAGEGDDNYGDYRERVTTLIEYLTCLMLALTGAPSWNEAQFMQQQVCSMP